MALLFMEGFGGYATGSQPWGENCDMKLNFMARGLGNDASITSFASTSEGERNYLTMPSGTSHLISYPFDSEYSTVYIGCRFYRTDSAGSLIGIVRGTTYIGTLFVDSLGYFGYTAWDNGQQDKGFPSNFVIPSHAWSYLEAKIYIHDSAGTVDLWINDMAAGSYTGKDTRHSGAGSYTCNGIVIGTYFYYGVNWPANWRITDIYVDTATRHGPVAVWYQPADSAGSSAGFTPLAGSNYQNVDDLGSDADTTYNYSTTTTNKDQIAHSDSLASAPLALQPLSMARAEGPGTGAIKVGVLSGATEDLDTAKGLPEGSYTGVRGLIYETDPNTASAWTQTNANNAETVYQHI